MSDVKAQMQTLITEAKAHKATRDLANMDYKHAMKKLSVLAESNPDVARELGIVEEKKDDKKSDGPTITTS